MIFTLSFFDVLSVNFAQQLSHVRRYKRQLILIQTDSYFLYLSTYFTTYGGLTREETRAFFDRFQKTQGRKNSRLKKTQGCFSAKNSTFRRFLRLQPKNSKEKIVHRKLFIWVDALNVIFMDMFVDFFNAYALLCAFQCFSEYKYVFLKNIK